MSLTRIKTLSIVGASALLLASNAFAQDLKVDLNRTQVVYLPTVAGAVVIGNPEIADVSVHSADTLFVVGRGYGQTNMIVMDQTGQTIMDSNIIVMQDIQPQTVRLIKLGAGRETYTCAPNCAPSPALGDSGEFIGQFSGGSVQILNSSATGPNTSLQPSPLSGAPLNANPASAPPVPFQDNER